MWSLDAEVKSGHALHTDGPCGITRHPIYTGHPGMLLGSVLLAGVGRWLLLLPVGFVLFSIKIRLDEKLLLTRFPDGYTRYGQRVPRPRGRRLSATSRVLESVRCRSLAARSRHPCCFSLCVEGSQVLPSREKQVLELVELTVPSGVGHRDQLFCAEHA
jgi:hypothetical protein